jgi:hypothetical protein
MTYVDRPSVQVRGVTTLHAYEVPPIDDDPDRRRFHVDVRGGTYGPSQLLFAGAMDDLHDFFLGLHNVLSDAAETGDGRAERVVLRPTEAVDFPDSVD